MITPEIRAAMRRLVLREGWKIETAARRFGVHHSVVRRAIRDPDGVTERRPPAPSELDPFREHIIRRLTEHPDLTAVRLFMELQGAGFKGGDRAAPPLRRQGPSPARPQSLPPHRDRAGRAGPGRLGLVRALACR